MSTIAAQARSFAVPASGAFASTVGFYFAFRLISVVSCVRLLGMEPQAGAAASLALNYFLLVLAAFVTYGPGSSSRFVPTALASFRWSIAFLLLSGCSLMWTSSASLWAAAAFWCAMACDFLIVVAMLRTGAVNETIAGVTSGYVAGACLVAAIAWIMPSQSDLRLGDEEYLGPNQIGYACAFAIFFAQYLMRRGLKGYMLPAAFLTLTLLRSLSKTTIVAFMAGQMLLLFKDRSVRAKTKMYIGVAGVLVVAGFWGLLAAYYDVYTHAGNQSETLTGRIGIWAFILSAALQQPWLGHGFHSVWKVIPPFGPFEARHAHNELLQQFYAYGVAGVCVVIALYSGVFRDIRKIASAPVRTVFFAMFWFVLVRGFADTEVFDLSLPLWAIALIGATVISQKAAVGAGLEAGGSHDHLECPPLGGE